MNAVAGARKSVERIGRIDGCKRHRGAGGGENRRDIGDRQRLDGRDALLAAGPFAGGKQRQREQAAENGAHAGAEQAGLDRIAHHEETAERQRQSADPHHPAGADRLLETAIGLRQRRRRCGRRAAAAARGSTGVAAVAAMDSRAGNDWRRLRHDAGEAAAGVCFDALSSGSGGGTGLATAAARFDRVQPRAQLRHLVHRFTAMIRRQCAMTNGKKSNGLSNISPPGGRATVNRSRRQRGPSQSSECSFAG